MKEIMEPLMELQQLDGARKGGSKSAAAKALRERIPEPVLNHYDRMRARGRKPVAIATASGVCGACHMMASRGMLSALERGDDLCICEHCGRYLMFKIELDPEAA